jgi:glycosyltransferase involved in cell wall biosynthesis
MKIAHITNYVVPDFGYEELQLAKAQAQLGHEVAIFTSNFLHPGGPAYGVLRARFPQRKVEPAEEIQSGVRIIRVASWELPGSRMWMHGLLQQVKTFAPDVVHCHNLLQIQTVRMAFAKAFGGLRLRLVVDDHMHASVVRRSMTGRAFYAFHRAAIQPILNREVDRFCAISEDTRNYLREMCGVKAEIELRPLGVDVDVFKPSTSLRAEWRRRFDVDEGDLVLLYTGKVIEAKGVHVLVAAGLRLLDEGGRVKVVVVGDADPGYLERLKHDIAVAGRVKDFHFHPGVQHAELPGPYASADIAVWPRQESMAIFEAMATAVPVVISGRSGYSTLVTNGPGVTFAHDDVVTLAGTLRGLFDPGRRTTHGAAGRAVTQSEYSWRRSAERYLQTYRAGSASVGADSGTL